MKKAILLLLISCSVSAQNFNFQRSWGTYFGDERFYLQDSKVDKQGNLYLVGYFLNGTSISTPVFSTSNSYQSTFGGGASDGFIAKFNNLGQLTLATYFGGSDTDIVSGIDIDASNNIYIVGSTSSTTNIATANAYQTAINGLSDFFIARFTPNGILNWSSYYGGTEGEGLDLNWISGGINENDTKLYVSHDKANNFYLSGYSDSPNMGTTGTFQPQQGQSNQIIAKFDNNGTNIWTTYHGSINPCYITAMNATPTALYIRGHVSSCNPGSPIPNNENYYGSLNGYQPTALGCINTYLSKFNIDGQREWSTYYGGNNLVGANSVKTIGNKIYFSGEGSGNLITTTGTFQENALGEIPPYIVQFTDNSTRNWGTFCGSNTGFPANGGTNPTSNLNIDGLGGIYLSGSTALHTNIATAGAYQSNLIGDYNGFVCKFNDQGQKIWGTYYGGNATEYSMITHPYNNNFYLVGTTTSTTSLTTPNCYQSNLATYDIDNGTPKNIFIAHFEPIPLTVNTFNENSFSIYPNPNNGSFMVLLKNENVENYTIEIFDVLGKKLFSQNLYNIENNIKTNNLSKGMYIAKITNAENLSFNTKIVVE